LGAHQTEIAKNDKSQKQREISKLKEYVYKIGGKVMLSRSTENECETTHLVPFASVTVDDNFLVCLKVKNTGRYLHQRKAYALPISY
jgi:hypothetical protein